MCVHFLVLLPHVAAQWTAMDYLKYSGKQMTANKRLLKAGITAKITDWKISEELQKACDLYCLTNTPWWHCRTFRQSRHWSQQSQLSPTSRIMCPPIMSLLQTFSLQLRISFSALAKLGKATVGGSTGLSVRPHGRIRLSLDGFSLKLGYEYFSKNCRENSSLIKTWQELTYTSHEDASHFFDHIYLIVSDKSCREDQNTFCV